MKHLIVLFTLTGTLIGCGPTPEQIKAQQEQAKRSLIEQNYKLAEKVDNYLSEKKDIFATTQAYQMFFKQEGFEFDYNHNNASLDDGMKLLQEEIMGCVTDSEDQTEKKCEDSYWSNSGTSCFDYIEDPDSYYLNEEMYNIWHSKYFIIKNKISDKPAELNASCYARKYDSNTGSTTEKYIDQTDECILQRRKHPNSSEVCWFNYKKYLPTDTKIKTDSDFIKLQGIINETLERNEWCDAMSDWTSAEKENCKQETKQFIYDYSYGKAKHCRDSHKKEWNQMLKESAQQAGGIQSVMKNLRKGEKERMIRTGEKSRAELDFVESVFQPDNIFAMIALQGMSDNIKKFGLINLCLTDGWDKDIQKLNK